MSSPPLDTFRKDLDNDNRFHESDLCFELEVLVKSKFYESYKTVKNMLFICASVTFFFFKLGYSCFTMLC